MNERPHTQLPVWQKSMQLLHYLYSVTGTFQSGEKDVLGRKIKDLITEVPVALALALGNGLRTGSSERLQRAFDATIEIDTLLQIATHTGMIKPDELEAIQNELIEIQKELLTLNQRVERKKR
ncbi:MAG: four helix bundle protein [Bacteroidales bacterium]|nr:four helix bundle protein [Bacteroidales bacterium]